MLLFTVYYIVYHIAELKELNIPFLKFFFIFDTVSKLIEIHFDRKNRCNYYVC